MDQAVTTRDPLIHPYTKRQIDAYLQNPSQAILLVGEPGSGKYTIASYIVCKLMQLRSHDDITKQPSVKIPLPLDASVIPIEFIRELRDFVKLKSTSRDTVQRVIVLPDAHRMPIPAQNALLKLLEEPPAGTVFVMTTHDTTALLPTVISRLRPLQVIPIAEADAKDYFLKPPITESAFKKAFNLSAGRAGLMCALLSDNQDHPLAQAVETAKLIVKETTFERLCRVDALSKDRASTLVVLEALERVYHALILSAAQAQKTALLKKYHHALTAIVNAKQSIGNNGLLKLVLLELFLEL